MSVRTAVVASMAIAATLLGVPAASASPMPQSHCPAVEIAVAAGTGQSTPHDDPSAIRSFWPGTNFALAMTQRFDNVRAWQLPYDASAGIIGTNVRTGQVEFPPYSVSQQHGLATLEAHLSTVAQQCPHTAFILAGYSQGADIAGDMAEKISRGTTAADLTPQRVLAVYLLADPQRAALTLPEQVLSTNTGTTGRRTEAGALAIDTADPSPAGAVGILGPRAAGAFDNLPATVRSICSNVDLVCAAQPEGFLSAVGSWANDYHSYEPTPVEPIHEMMRNGSLFRAFAPVAGPLAQAIVASDAQAIQQLCDSASQHPSLSEAQRTTVRLLGAEISGIVASAPPRDYTGDIYLETAADARATLQQWRQFFQALESLALRETGLDHLYADAGLVSVHTSYLGASQRPSTIGNQRVDDWIDSDMTAVIATYLGTPPDAPVLPHTTIDERSSWVHRIGRLLLRLVGMHFGTTSQQSLALWGFLDRFNPADPVGSWK